MIPIVISSTGIIPKSLSQSLTRLNLPPQYIYTTAKICNSWHMFNCKKLFKTTNKTTEPNPVNYYITEKANISHPKLRSEKFDNNINNSNNNNNNNNNWINYYCCFVLFLLLLLWAYVCSQENVVHIHRALYTR